MKCKQTLLHNEKDMEKKGMTKQVINFHFTQFTKNCLLPFRYIKP
jgi:hypothetical protein